MPKRIPYIGKPPIGRKKRTAYITRRNGERVTYIEEVKWQNEKKKIVKFSPHRRLRPIVIISQEMIDKRTHRVVRKIMRGEFLTNKYDIESIKKGLSIYRKRKKRLTVADVGRTMMRRLIIRDPGRVLFEKKRDGSMKITYLLFGRRRERMRR